MVYRYFSREGIAVEQQRQELLKQVAREQSIVAARRAESDDPRPFAAPGSFLVFLRQHFASGRFHPALIPTFRPGGAIGR